MGGFLRFKWHGGDLNDAVVVKRVHVTSLIGTRDLFYKPSQPLVGGNALVVCARVGSRLFAIYADRKAQNIGETEFREAWLVPLEDAPIQTQKELRGQPTGISQ